MSNFWSGWVMALVVINYTTILFLFIWASRVDIPVDDDGTTGHTWANGTIREGLNKLPKWWLIMSTLGFIAAFIYLVRYPGFGNFEGVTGWTSTKQLHEQIIDSNAKKQPLISKCNHNRFYSSPVTKKRLKWAYGCLKITVQLAMVTKRKVAKN